MQTAKMISKRIRKGVTCIIGRYLTNIAINTTVNKLLFHVAKVLLALVN